MPRADVAYENTAEARKKLRSIKPLRWHRASYGLKAEGTRGAYALVQRSPDRRRGIFPWVVRQGGVKGPEIKPGGFDTAGEAKDFARLFDAGLCGAPPQVVVQAAPGMPAGTYRGTMAGEDRQYDAYKYEVAKALSKMQVPDTVYRQAHVNRYLEDMAKAGVDANITAAVIAGTVRHSHNHDCPEKHVEVNEAGEAKRRRGTPPIFQTLQQRLDAGGYPTVNWPPFHIYYVGGDKYQNGPDARGALRNFRLEGNKERVTKVVAVDMSGGMGPQDVNHPDFIYYISPDDTLEMEPSEGGAEEAKKRLWQPDPSTGLYITHSSYTRNYFLMRGDELVAIENTRPEIESVARKMTEDMRKPASASEGRRPKG